MNNFIRILFFVLLCTSEWSFINAMESKSANSESSQGSKKRTLDDFKKDNEESPEETEHSTKKQELQCAICFENIDTKEAENQFFTCNHIFHEHCILEWMKTSSQAECPTCRSKKNQATQDAEREEARAAKEAGAFSLHTAAKNGDLDAAALLPGTNAEDIHGRTPLHWAAENGDTEMVALLLDKDLDINAHGRYTALDVAVAFKHTATAALLLNKGADPTIQDENRRTALHTAAQNGDTAIVALMLHKGADINTQDIDGNTPLHIAVMYNRRDIVELLLKKGADINAQNIGLRTALDIATQVGNTEIIQLLTPSKKPSCIIS